MKEVMTIKLRNKKAKALLKTLADLKVIEITDDRIPSHWTEKKKQQARDLLGAITEARLAEAGVIQLKTVDSLIAGLQALPATKKKLRKKKRLNKQAGE